MVTASGGEVDPGASLHCQTTPVMTSIMRTRKPPSAAAIRARSARSRAAQVSDAATTSRFTTTTTIGQERRPARRRSPQASPATRMISGAIGRARFAHVEGELLLDRRAMGREHVIALSRGRRSAAGELAARGRICGVVAACTSSKSRSRGPGRRTATEQRTGAESTVEQPAEKPKHDRASRTSSKARVSASPDPLLSSRRSSCDPSARRPARPCEYFRNLTEQPVSAATSICRPVDAKQHVQTGFGGRVTGGSTLVVGLQRPPRRWPLGVDRRPCCPSRRRSAASRRRRRSCASSGGRPDGRRCRAASPSAAMPMGTIASPSAGERRVQHEARQQSPSTPTGSARCGDVRGRAA